MLKELVMLASVFPILYSQLIFPDAENGSEQQQITNNLTALRGTTLYEEYVNSIISDGILKLTLAVNKAIVQTSKDTYNNVVFAPVSIAAALALILMGSNGKTFQEVSTIMGLATGVDIQDKSQIVHEQFGRMIELLQRTSGFNIGSQVNFATGIFVQDGYPIRRAYRRTAEMIYKSEILNVDFMDKPVDAQETINAWVTEKTDGKISRILEERPSSTTRVILASAMYFKAKWEKPFFDGDSLTRRRPFYPDGKKGKSTIMVDMMSVGGMFPYYKDPILDCEILGFPYKGNQTTMYVVMPRDSNVENLKQLETRLTFTEMTRLVENVNYTGAVIGFPKMRIDSTIDLRRSLQLLGLTTLFSPKEANLALLSPGLNTRFSAPQAEVVQNPTHSTSTTGDDDTVLIFSRNGGEPVNCTPIFDPASNVNVCQETMEGAKQNVTYKKFGNKVGRRVSKRISQMPPTESLDSIRHHINSQPNPYTFENPGLYADNVIHKVYMDITESGTEAAAATTVSLTRDGGRIMFRVDVPFFFFIMHEDTKTVLFWGSVNKPTPNYYI